MLKDYFEKYRIVLGLVLVFLICLYSNDMNKKEERILNTEIDKNLVLSIAKVKDKGRHYIKYIYYWNNNRYEGFSEQGGRSLIGKFFIVELSKIKPELSRIKLDNEVKDSTKIANSGFRKKTLDEILETK